MNEKYIVEFTDEEYERIKQYMDAVEAIDIKAAIMNAISVAHDDADWSEAFRNDEKR